MNKGGVFIISGPSGSGKDTVLAELFRNKPDLKFSISSITRDMRAASARARNITLSQETNLRK